MIGSTTNRATSNGTIQPSVIHLHVCAHRGPRPFSRWTTCFQHMSGEAWVMPWWQRIQDKPSAFLPKYISPDLWNMKASLLPAKQDVCLQQGRHLQPKESQGFRLSTVNDGENPWKRPKRKIWRFILHSKIRGEETGKAKKLYYGVLALIEWDKARLKPMYYSFLNSAMMGVSGQRFGEIGI